MGLDRAEARGHVSSSPELEDYVDSLVDNGVDIQVQLIYGNVMYTSPSGKRPDVSIPESGSFHNDDRSLYSVFWPPTTPEQIAAFNRYAAWMVNHFHDRIHYWALWNEQDIGYWNPWGNPEQFGRLLGSFYRDRAPNRSASQSDLWRSGGPHRGTSRSVRSILASAPQESMCMPITRTRATVRT